MEEVKSAIGATIRSIRSKNYSEYNKFSIIKSLYLNQKDYLAGISFITSSIPKLKEKGIKLEALSEDLALMYNLLTKRKIRDLRTQLLKTLNWVQFPKVPSQV